MLLQKETRKVEPTKRRKEMKEIQIAKRADKGLFYVINENGRVDLIYREQGEEDLVIIDPTFEYVEYWLRDFDGEE